MNLSFNRTLSYKKSNSCNIILSALRKTFPFRLWRTVMTPHYRTKALWEQHNGKKKDETKWPTTNCSTVQKSLKTKRWRPISNGKYSLQNDSCTSHVLFPFGAVGGAGWGHAMSLMFINFLTFMKHLQLLKHNAGGRGRGHYIRERVHGSMDPQTVVDT